MKGLYHYYDRDFMLREVHDTDDIPASAVELVRFDHPPIPPPPHTQADHDFIDTIRAEFSKVYERIYKMKPPKKEAGHADGKSQG